MYNTIAQNPFLFTVVLAWILAWKGVALWRAARADSKKLFVVLLLINTMGLLEIVYIYYFSNKEDSCCCQLKEK